MAWSIRSLSEASSAIRGAFRQHLPGTDASLKNNFVTVVAKVLAGMAHEFELRMGYLARQLFASTASLPFLKLHGADVGIYLKPASSATGMVEGTGAASTIYPSGIRFVSGADTYVSTAPAQSSSNGFVTFPIVAELKGSSTNRDAGGQLTLADPGLYPTLDNAFVVSSDGLGGGADIEDVEDFRARILFRKANPPGAGKLSDYERIVRDVPGVLKAWAWRRPTSPGYLVVYFLFDGRTNRIPTAGDVLVAQAALDQKRLIRIDRSVVAAPTPEPLNPVIGSLATDSAAVRAGIAAAIDAVLYEKAMPVPTGETFWLSRSWISEAVSQVTGESSHVLLWPLDDLPYTAGRYPVVGEVSYV